MLSSITLVTPQATARFLPMTMPGAPATDAPTASMPGACRPQKYHVAGSRAARWGSLARIGRPSADLEARQDQIQQMSLNVFLSTQVG